jgi:hypothetical protein
VIGGTALVASFVVGMGEGAFDRAGLAAANAAENTLLPAALLTGVEFPLCHTPAAGNATAAMIRLAATRTEVLPTEMKAATPAPEFADIDPPLWDGLGPISYKITTANVMAQAYFDQGLRLAYAFNHGEAQRAFRKGQKLDPHCAMCFWGEGLVLGPNINLPMQEDAVAPAFTAMEKARAFSANATAREQALIGALALRYAPDAKADRAPLDAAYAAAMGKAAAAFPDDDEIAVLYAEAVMDVSPWNYWQPGGREPNPQSVPIVPTLERVLARSPNHPGAIHYYIHAVEASDRPQRAEPYADRLRGAIPGAGHLVHMPSHIYYRVGRYLDALADNRAQRLRSSGAGRPEACPRRDCRPHRAGRRRLQFRHRALRAGGGHSGRIALYRAALLVLSGAPIAGGGAAAGGPPRGGRRPVPARAQACARQRLVVFRARRGVQGARRCRGRRQGGGRSRPDLGRRSRAPAGVQPVRRLIRQATSSTSINPRGCQWW